MHIERGPNWPRRCCRRGRRRRPTCTACALTTARSSCCSHWATCNAGCCNWWPTSRRFTSTALPRRRPCHVGAAGFQALARLAAPQATLATWSVAKSWARPSRRRIRADRRRALTASARQVARLNLVFTPRRSLARQAAVAPARKHAVIIGAGLAGCATAWALAQQSWTSSLLERCEAVAQEASGNPAGAFHGIVNPQDGAHARFNRAAALHAQGVISHAVRSGGVAGHLNGLLRLESRIRHRCNARHPAGAGAAGRLRARARRSASVATPAVAAAPRVVLSGRRVCRPSGTGASLPRTEPQRLYAVRGPRSRSDSAPRRRLAALRFVRRVARRSPHRGLVQRR